MKKNTLFLLAFATLGSIFTVSCGDDGGVPTTPTTINMDTTKNDNSATDSTDTLSAVDSTKNLPTPTQEIVVVDPSGKKSNVTGKAINNPYANLKGNNPAHGEPNHRCDIPEGAPLNSPPGGAPTVTPVTNTAAPAKVKDAYSGKPNPKHGDPGHRCEVPEG